MTSSYDVYTAQVRECDVAIERQFQAIMPVWDDDLPPLDRQDKALSHRKNASAYDACSLLYQLTRVDLVAIPCRHRPQDRTHHLSLSPVHPSHPVS
jgi:hypothetical protein